MVRGRWANIKRWKGVYSIVQETKSRGNLAIP